MDHTYVDLKNLKSLEELIVYLASNRITLQTLHSIQMRALTIGIMTEDQCQRAGLIIQDLENMDKLYLDQMYSVFELLPEDFKKEAVIQRLQEAHLRKARALTRKPKVKKCDT